MNSRLQELIEAEIARVPAADLARATRELTERYRGERKGTGALLTSDAHRAAYLAVRMPATYAAIESALRRLREAMPELAPVSVLDLGAGPGTATLAAREVFASVQTAHMIERDARWTEIARRFVGAGATLEVGDVNAAQLSSAQLPSADLVMVAYALNELSSSARAQLVQRAWSAAKHALVIIEPGSRDGFAHVLDTRRFFIEQHATIAAPCPAEMACPLAAVGDWCHFAARVQRTALHRRLKGAELSYEDEKFSYVIGIKSSEIERSARIVRRPEKLKGHVKLTLCTIEGLRQIAVTKKSGADYKRARDAEWGDVVLAARD